MEPDWRQTGPNDLFHPTFPESSSGQAVTSPSGQPL